MMELQSLFPTPLWTSQFNDSPQLARWADRVISLKEADPLGVQLTNHGAWHSQTMLLQDPGLHALFSWVAAEVHGALSAWGWDMEQARPCFNNAWAVISRSGDSHSAHIHPNSLFSGVFYLSAPAGSGAIAFLDPRAGALMLQPPLSRQAAFREIGRQRLVPQPGGLLLFPAWLWHEVEPSRCQEPRICISFNVGMRPVAGSAVG